MNYELAKKLKDAGFPQTGLRFTWYYEGNHIYNSGEEYFNVAEHPGRIIAPTLEELIEACRDHLNIIHRDNLELKWFAGIGDGQDGGPMHHSAFPFGSGETPLIAVANLWLELNKK